MPMNNHQTSITAVLSTILQSPELPGNNTVGVGAFKTRFANMKPIKQGGDLL